MRPLSVSFRTYGIVAVVLLLPFYVAFFALLVTWVDAINHRQRSLASLTGLQSFLKTSSFDAGDPSFAAWCDFAAATWALAVAATLVLLQTFAHDPKTNLAFMVRTHQRMLPEAVDQYLKTSGARPMDGSDRQFWVEMPGSYDTAADAAAAAARGHPHAWHMMPYRSTRIAPASLPTNADRSIVTTCFAASFIVGFAMAAIRGDHIFGASCCASSLDDHDARALFEGVCPTTAHPSCAHYRPFPAVEATLDLTNAMDYTREVVYDRLVAPVDANREVYPRASDLASLTCCYAWGCNHEIGCGPIRTIHDAVVDMFVLGIVYTLLYLFLALLSSQLHTIEDAMADLRLSMPTDADAEHGEDAAEDPAPPLGEQDLQRMAIRSETPVGYIRRRRGQTQISF